jgi:hypothetical protein
METNNNDQMIRNFFQQNKVEIEDYLFTRRVMQKLPARSKNYEWIIVLFTAIGTLIAGLLGWDNQLPAFTLALPRPDATTLYYLLGGIFVSPFVIMLFYGLLNNKRVSWI